MDWSFLFDPGFLASLGVGGAIVGLPAVYRVLSGFKFSGGDEDVADILAAKRLAARFARMNCPEGQKAVKTLLNHFFDHVESK